VPARFYCPDPPIDGVYRLKANEAKHLSRACRLGPGDEIEIFDGAGFAIRARVLALGSDWVDLAALGDPLPERSPMFPLVLATAAPKGDRLDWLVEKATELGVARLIPVMSTRAVVEPGLSKISRLERAVIEASKQCGRARLMGIDAPRQWSTVVDSFAGSCKYLADAHGAAPSELPGIPIGHPAILAVGPEGGFTAEERQQAVSAGWHLLRVGVNTLRVETAAVAGVAALLAIAKEPEE
jgi:16S rRNA (uracil1498-N3)-methyltransferase